MALFNNLDLDEDEQDFIDSTQDLSKHKNLYQKPDKYGADEFNQTMVTNLDDELEQMEQHRVDQAD